MNKLRHLPLLAILLLAALVRAWISDFTLVLLDYDAFYHARIAQTVYTTGHIPAWDALELGGIPHYYPPGYHILIAVGKYIMPGHSFIAVGGILTVFFGTISTLFVYLVGRGLGKNTAIVAALLYTLTPMMVLRSGLWARPTGISMMLVLLLVYLFIRTSNARDRRYVALALIAGTAYVFTHSSVLLVLPLIFAASLAAGENDKAKTVLGVSLISLLCGLFYYYRFFPHLNLQVAKSGEYMPLIEPIGALDPSFGSLLAAMLFLGLFNLAFFPLVFHGIYDMTKRKRLLGILGIFSLLLPFLWANMFMLFNFMVPIAIAVSISRVSKIGSHQAAAALLLMVLLMDTSLLLLTHGEKKHPNVDITGAVLAQAPMSPANLVLASDTNVGHAIPYFSPASTFISDLTDTKKYSKNRKVYDVLKGGGIETTKAVKLLNENSIDHVLVIGDTAFPFTKDEEYFESIKTAKRDVNATLYRLK